MEKEKVIALLQKVYDRKLPAFEAFEQLRHLPYEDLGFAKIDHHRTLRGPLPEVIFCEGKPRDQITAIFKSLWKKNARVLLTRAGEKTFQDIQRCAPCARYHPAARTITVAGKPLRPIGKVTVVSAGTADIPVAEEAAVTAEIFGSRVDRYFDIGVAGIQRLLDCFKEFSDSRCIVAAAGMDGALPSVIGGLAGCPVIAVPTSVGYGSHFKGLASLLTMLNSCSPNVAVVNIDNGFGAGYLATMINRK